MVPETTISCSGREAKKVIRLVDALEDPEAGALARSLCLLRRQEPGRPLEGPALGERLELALAEVLGEAKVRQEVGVALAEDVRRLEVAVQDPLRVGSRQRSAQGDAEPERLLAPQGPPPEPLL